MLVALTEPLHWTAAVYIVAFIVGGGLLALSTLGGGESDADLDFDGDVDLSLDGADVDLDVDGANPDVDTAAHGLGGIATWLSMRFVVFAMATGGAIGTALTFLSDLSVSAVAACAAIAAVVCGQVAHQTMRHLQRSGGNSAAELDDFVHQVARVTVPVRGQRRGEIAVMIRGTERFLAAVARNADDHFDANSTVVIAGFANGLALVVGRDEFEFVTASVPGGLHE